MSDKLQTVKENMPARSIFATPEDAANFLSRMAEEMSDFDETPAAMVGIDDEGNFDTEVYNDDSRVMVSVLRYKQEVKAITVVPVPTMESLMSDDAGQSWVDKILLKELAHVSVRPLRDADDITTVIDQMPSTRDEYISSGRGQSSGIMAAFNETYKDINSLLSTKVSTWRKARLVKAELKKCFESAGYAMEFYPAIEDRGEDQKSLFVLACELGVAIAKKQGLDATVYERWLETRDQKEFTPADSGDLDGDSLDLASLTDELMTDDEDGDES